MDEHSYVFMYWISVKESLPTDDYVKLVFAPLQQQLLGYFNQRKKNGFISQATMEYL